MDAVAVEGHDGIFTANRAVGRIAVVARVDGGTTRRLRVHETGPLRVRFPGPAARELEAVIVNTAGGAAGGDRLDLAFAVGAGASLVVTTAAAEKIYRSLGPDTTIGIKLDVGAGAALAWIPQETILFDRARMVRTIDVDLAEDARLILAEAIIFGRTGMGEAVERGRLVDRWRVRRAGRLLCAETISLDGAVAEKLRERAMTGGRVAVATVLAVPGDNGTVEQLRAVAAGCHGEVGVSAWNGFALARLCAPDGAGLRHDLVGVIAALRGQSLPRLWSN